MTMAEAAAVTDIGTAFKDSLFYRFDEFVHFTSLTYIVGYAFSNTRISRIYIPEGVQTIGKGSQFAFSSDYIYRVEFPTTFRGFESTYNFFNCAGLSIVVFKNPNPPTTIPDQPQFGKTPNHSNIRQNGTIYVPVGSASAYASKGFLTNLLNKNWTIVETL